VAKKADSATSNTATRSGRAISLQLDAKKRITPKPATSAPMIARTATMRARRSTTDRPPAVAPARATEPRPSTSTSTSSTKTISNRAAEY
jgi:hypothetical protein